MGTTWVQVAAAPLPQGITHRHRAGRGWAPGELDDQTPVLVDDAALAELERDGLLRVRRLSEEQAREAGVPKDAEVISPPQRLPIAPEDAALERLERLKRENAALKAQKEIADLEAENERLRREAQAKTGLRSAKTTEATEGEGGEPPKTEGKTAEGKSAKTVDARGDTSEPRPTTTPSGDVVRNRGR